MEIISPGIGLIFWMTLVFSALLFILKKYAWKPIMTALNEREQDISSSLEMAKQTKSEMKKLKADNDNLFIEARKEREAILAEANKTKVQIINDAKETAIVEANRIVEAARLNIESEKRAALSEIKSQVAEFSIEIAEKILRSELSDKEKQDKLIKEHLDKLQLN